MSVTGAFALSASSVLDILPKKLPNFEWLPPLFAVWGVLILLLLILATFRAIRDRPCKICNSKAKARGANCA